MKMRAIWRRMFYLVVHVAMATLAFFTSRVILKSLTTYVERYLEKWEIEIHSVSLKIQYISI